MTQNRRLLARLQKGYEPTPIDALRDMGIHRLGARVLDLRKEGHLIVTERVTVTNRFGETCSVARYSLKDKTA